MRKIRLEKVTGVVALAYLVLIPAGAFYAWRRTLAMENDIQDLWEKTGMPHDQAVGPTIASMIRGLSGR